MNESLQPLFELLGGKIPWLPKLILWIGALQVAFFFVRGALTKWIANTFNYIIEHSSTDSNHFLERMVASPFYSGLRFLLLIVSLPLPSREDYEAAYQRWLKNKQPSGYSPLILIPFLVGSLFLAGCASDRLELGGAYAPAITNSVGVVTNAVAPDISFFAVDSSFDIIHATVDAVFKYEQDHRELLWKISPDIKHKLDRIRPTADKCVLDYAIARMAYEANPVPANLPRLKSVLGRLKTVLASANAVLPKE